MIILFEYEIFIKLRGFFVLENIIAPIVLFISFYFLPIEEINYKIKNVLNIMTSFTQGIYCLHLIIAYYVHHFFDKNRTFLGCVLVYLISYVISFFFANIFRKNKLKYLFM